MDIICNVLVIFATIDLVFFAIEEGRRIYRRYQAKKDLEAFADWAKKRLEDHAKKQQEDEKEEG